ncbi:hypothetical protein DYH09_24315 [bacterium CPR1]|nr:hypothetical protein [bacterium CPR1]
MVGTGRLASELKLAGRRQVGAPGLTEEGHPADGAGCLVAGTLAAPGMGVSPTAKAGRCQVRVVFGL